MTTSPFNGDYAQDLVEALEEFVWEYRSSAAGTISEFLDDWLDHGPERVALEAQTLDIFEAAGDQIAAILKKGLQH